MIYVLKLFHDDQFVHPLRASVQCLYICQISTASTGYSIYNISVQAQTCQPHCDGSSGRHWVGLLLSFFQPSLDETISIFKKPQQLCSHGNYPHVGHSFSGVIVLTQAENQVVQAASIVFLSSVCEEGQPTYSEERMCRRADPVQ